MKRHGRSASLGLLGLLFALSMLLAPASASADKVVVNAIGSGTFGTSGGLFSFPFGLAVNTTGSGGVPAGTVYVVDAGNNRVQAFSSSGEFLRAFGADVGGPGVDICTVAATCTEGTAGEAAGQFGSFGARGIAVDQINGNVYVTDETNRRVDAFSATGAFEGAFGWGVDTGAEALEFCTSISSCQAPAAAGSNAGQFGTTLGYPAVAPPGSPEEGHIYVADGANRRVDEFEPTIVAGEVTGIAFVRGYGWGASTGAEEFEVCTATCHAPFNAGASSGQFATEAPSQLGIDAAGNVYALDPGNNRVQKFSPSATPLDSSFASAQLGTAPAPLDIAADPSVGGHVYVDKSNGTEINTLEFKSNGSFVAVNGEKMGLTLTGGVAYDPTSGNIWVSGLVSQRLFALNTEIPPTVALSEPVDVTGPNSAVFEGEVNPEGFGASYRFEYSSDGGASWTPLPDVDLGPGTSPIPVSQEATALLANTEYLVRLVATKAFGGGSATTAPATFQTPAGAPSIESVSTESIASSSAELSAKVNPEGAAASCSVEYGTEEGVYDHESACSPAELEAQNEVQEITVDAITGQFKLRFGGQQTGNLNFNAPIENVRFALGALASIGAGNVSVSGGPVAGEATRSYFVTFKGALVGEDVEQISIENGAIPLSTLNNNGEVVPGIVSASTVLNGGLSSPISVFATIGGLEPDTVYHYRFVAANTVGATAGSDHVLRTFADVGAGLPDGRAYEMVSPPQKLGEVFAPEPVYELGGRLGPSCPGGECLPGANNTLMPMQSAPDGESIVFEGQPLFKGLAAAPNEYLSHRTASGWGTQSLSPPLSSGPNKQGYKAVSTDLSRGVLYQIEPALSPSAPTFEGKSYANLYLTDGTGSLQPLITKKPPHREPGENGNFRVSYGGANAGAAASPAFSHVVFAADDALTGEVPGVAPDAPEVEASACVVEFEFCNLYEWSGGQLRLVNVLPGNSAAAPGAVLGSGRRLPDSINAEFYAPAVDHAISSDGSRIFWTEEPTGQVFVRIDGERTEEIEDHEGRFLTASVDGSKVLLNDGCLYDVDAEPPAEPCTDLTAGEGEFQGILGATENLSRIYFVDRAALTGTEENANEEVAEPGAFNLYAWDESETTFIGRLLEGDNQIGGALGFGAWKAASLNRTAQVSSDGRFLAFMSQAPLTGYDNEVRSSGCKGEAEGTPRGGTICFEVFEYDASSASLTCASCNPSGQRPLGQSNLSLLRPQPISRQPGNLSADGQGRLFFESQDTLSPRDTNGAIQDVYEWEPNGVGSCKRAEGCISLISSGRASGDSFFLDATPSGNDAFFVTREKLLPQDTDDRLDLYDARVGGFEEATSAPCGGETCKGPLTPVPGVPGAASSSFIGPDNPKHVCPRSKVRKRGKCVKKRHAKKRAAKHNRGGSK